MLRKTTMVAVLSLLAGARNAGAQVTAQPSYNAPYRGFTRFEFGAALSFPSYDAGTAIEGMYRFATREFDVGFRGGMLFPDGGLDESFLVGVEGRYRAITHSVSFPLDGAIIFGGGLATDYPPFGGSAVFFPFGLSLGRRVQVEGSEVSIVPYVQPTIVLLNREIGLNRDTDAQFTFGVGGDFRLSRAFDARLSFGFGDLEGISIAAVWLR